MVQYSVLIVADDVKLVNLLKTHFERVGFITHSANDGIDALQWVWKVHPDIMVLDSILPGLDGVDVCRRIRRDNDMPIIMLTEREEEQERPVGIEMRADDYMTKPCRPKEVVARAKVILRWAHKEVIRHEPVKAGSLFIDLESHLVTQGSQSLELTPTEFKILELLATNVGRVFSRLQIFKQIQGYTFEGYGRTIDAHVKNLRRKLMSNPKEPQYIQTVYGVGYKFVVDSNE